MKPKRSRNMFAAKSSVYSELNATETYQRTSAQDSEAYLALRNRYNLPQRNWTFFDGVRDCGIASWYRTHLVYCYTWQGRPVEGKWDTMPEALKEEIRQGKMPVESGHYWLNKDGTIGRPFFVSKG